MGGREPDDLGGMRTCLAQNMQTVGLEVFREKTPRPGPLSNRCFIDQLRCGNRPMITVRRAMERSHDRSTRQERWMTFGPSSSTGHFVDGFWSLEILEEIRLAPCARVSCDSRHAAEIVTYVHEGVLAYEDSMGHASVLQASEFQRVTSGRSLRHSKMNPSRTDWAHFYQIWLHSSDTDLEPEHVQKRFSAADRREGLCLIASLDARKGSLRIRHDALIYSALLNPGQHLVRDLSLGRSAWIHVVHGEIALGDNLLTTGDGAGITAERPVSFTARQNSEILLVELGESQSKRAGGPDRPGRHHSERTAISW
jgi:quercetin 2,3-dioxygenase